MFEQTRQYEVNKAQKFALTCIENQTQSRKNKCCNDDGNVNKILYWSVGCCANT